MDLYGSRILDLPAYVITNKPLPCLFLCENFVDTVTSVTEVVIGIFNFNKDRPLSPLADLGSASGVPALPPSPKQTQCSRFPVIFLFVFFFLNWRNLILVPTSTRKVGHRTLTDNPRSAPSYCCRITIDQMR